jgi:hypothetical protein
MERFNNIDTENYSNIVDEAIGAATAIFGKTDAQKDLKAMCGRKPIAPITKKAKAQKKKYEECVAGLRNPSPQSGGGSTPPPPEKSYTGLYIGIGVGVLAITALIIFRKRIF